MQNSYEEAFNQIKEQLNTLSKINGYFCDTVNNFFSQASNSESDVQSLDAILVQCMTDGILIDISEAIQVLIDCGYPNADDLLWAVDDYKDSLLSRIYTTQSTILSLQKLQHNATPYNISQYNNRREQLQVAEKKSLEKSQTLQQCIDDLYKFMDMLHEEGENDEINSNDIGTNDLNYGNQSHSAYQSITRQDDKTIFNQLQIVWHHINYSLEPDQRNNESWDEYADRREDWHDAINIMEKLIEQFSIDGDTEPTPGENETWDEYMARRAAWQEVHANKSVHNNATNHYAQQSTSIYDDELPKNPKERIEIHYNVNKEFIGKVLTAIVYYDQYTRTSNKKTNGFWGLFKGKQEQQSKHIDSLRLSLFNAIYGIVFYIIDTHYDSLQKIGKDEETLIKTVETLYTAMMGEFKKKLTFYLQNASVANFPAKEEYINGIADFTTMEAFNDICKRYLKEIGLL